MMSGLELSGPVLADLEQARLFFDQYTRRGRSPADDLEGTEIAA